MNALLVYPEFPRTYWSFHYAMRFIRRRSAMPPLGLLTVASLFPRHWRLKLVDMNVEPLEPEHLAWADAVFLSAMIVQRESLERVIALCGGQEKPVVLGGPYATSSWREISGVDHFVLGEAEHSFERFLEDFEAGRARPCYVEAPKAGLESVPVPRYDLLDLRKYGSMALQYSRGCPFRCEFCDIWKMFGNRPRVKPPARVLEELETLRALGWRDSVFIVDDNFIGNKKEVKGRLLPAVAEWQRKRRHPFRFFTEASMNLAGDAELMEAMREAGFYKVFVGIESPSAESLKEANKGQNLRLDLNEAVRRIQSHGLEVTAGFIVGFDSDGEDVFRRQAEFIGASGIPMAMVGLLTALPGTDLHARLEGEGRILHASTGNNTHGCGTNFVPRMDHRALVKGYHQLLDHLYGRSLKQYFKRCALLFDRLGRSPGRPFQWGGLRIALRSLLHQPFTAYGWNYSTFILRTLWRRPALFGEAISHSIAGHHFQRITQETLKSQAVSQRIERCAGFLEEMARRLRALQPANPVAAQRMQVQLVRYGKRSRRRLKKRLRRLHRDFRAIPEGHLRRLEEALQDIPPTGGVKSA